MLACISALGLLYSGQRKDFLGEDIIKCLFFENGWYTKTISALSGWNNKSVIRGIPDSPYAKEE